MKLQQLIITIVAFSSLLFATPAQAAVFEVSNSSFTSEEEITSDLYSAGEQISVEHSVNGDAFVAGNQVNISGPIEGDVISVGEQIIIKAQASDDIMAAGNTITLDGASGDDVFVGGNTVTISGNFDGDVWLGGSKIVVKDGTTIVGNLRTASGNQPEIEDNVTIGGDHVHRLYEGSKKPGIQLTLLGGLRGLASLVLIALVIHYLFPSLSGRVHDSVIKKPLASIGLGAAWLILVLPAFVMLLISTVGAPLAFLILLLTPALLIIAWTYAAIVAGRFVLDKAFKKTDLAPWQTIVVGAIVLTIAGLIPIVGDLAIFLLVLTTLGATLTTLASQLKHSR